MSKLSLCFFCLLFLIFPSIKSQNELPLNDLSSFIENSKEILDCIKEKNIFDEKEIESIQNNLENFSPEFQTQLSEFFTKNYKKVFVCLSESNIPLFPDGTKLVDYDKIFAEQFDWVKIFFCLLRKIQENGTEAFEDLLRYIREENLFEAVKEIIKLSQDEKGIMECVPLDIE